MRGFLGLVILLLTAPAWAESSAELAEQASDAHAAYCANTAGGDVGLTSQAVARVGEVWDRVAQVDDAESEPFLLYWRAKLGECLGHPDLAKTDYEAFVEAVGDSTLYAGLAKDAHRRLRRLELIQQRASRPTLDASDIVLTVGGVASGAGAVLGLVGAFQWSTLLEQYAQFVSHPQSESQYAIEMNQLERLDITSQGLGVTGSLVGAIGLGALTVGAVAKGRSRAAVAVVPVPSPDGFTLAIAGRF